MRKTLAALSLLPAAAVAAEPQFTTHRLTDAFYCEGAGIGDVNNDGYADVVSALRHAPAGRRRGRPGRPGRDPVAS